MKEASHPFEVYFVIDGREQSQGTFADDDSVREVVRSKFPDAAFYVGPDDDMAVRSGNHPTDSLVFWDSAESRDADFVLDEYERIVGRIVFTRPTEPK